MTEEQREKKLTDDADEVCFAFNFRTMDFIKLLILLLFLIKALSASLNFRIIIELLIESKKPIVGHNCLLDMCQLVHQFWEELPEKLKDWKKVVHDLFEV